MNKRRLIWPIHLKQGNHKKRDQTEDYQYSLSEV